MGSVWTTCCQLGSIKLSLALLLILGPWQVLSEKCLNKRCQVDVYWQLHRLPNFLIFVFAASSSYQGRERSSYFTNRKWSEGETKLACMPVIAQSSPPKNYCKWLFFFAGIIVHLLFKTQKLLLPLCIKCDLEILGIMQPHIYIIKWQIAIYFKPMESLFFLTQQSCESCQKHWCLSDT